MSFGKKGDFGGKKIHTDEKMEKVFGTAPMKPMEMTGKLWKYIKSHKVKREGMFVTPDPILGAIIGKGKIKTTKMTKHLWAYIKKHKLFK